MEKIHLQGVGQKTAIPVSDLKIGMTILYNYGYTSVVKNITPLKSGKSVKITTLSNSNGKQYTSTKQNTTLVTIVI